MQEKVFRHSLDGSVDRQRVSKRVDPCTWATKSVSGDFLKHGCVDTALQRLKQDLESLAPPISSASDCVERGFRAMGWTPLPVMPSASSMRRDQGCKTSSSIRIA